LERVSDPDSAVDRMLAQTGLAARADEEVGRLSGGNRQRLNVAIGLLADPPLLLLDEPTSSLDPRQRVVLWQFIAELADAGTTVLFTTHHVAEAHRYADRLLVLAKGRVVFEGSEEQLRAEAGEAADDFEAAFVALLGDRES
jgi:ABC-2 type transport system ATP-binding protein